MSANVETMAYNAYEDGVFSERKVPWHGLGTPVDHAMTSEEALVYAGLDWNVLIGDAVLRTADGTLVDTEKKITYRDKDMKPLGMVSGQYSVVQNKDAFSFTDQLIGTGEVKYETAGALDGGKKVFLLANLPETIILGDKFIPHMLFSNSHDGSSSVRVTATPVRVVCENTMNQALESAKRIWSFVHRGDINSKVLEAKETLLNMKAYMEELNKDAERLAGIKISGAMLQQFMNQMFPIDDEKDYTLRQTKNAMYLREMFMGRYNMDDLGNFRGTAWGLLNAASDFASHTRPLRLTKNHQEKVMMSFMNGNQILDATYDFINAMAA